MKDNSLLIFVYNADNGFVNSLIDYVHKTISPKTYQCNLCAITYDSKGMKKDWKKFIESLDYPVTFLHKDQFEKEYGMKEAELPAVYIKKDSEIKLFISQKEINMSVSVDDLEKLVTSKLNEVSTQST